MWSQNVIDEKMKISKDYYMFCMKHTRKGKPKSLFDMLAHGMHVVSL